MLPQAVPKLWKPSAERAVGAAVPSPRLKACVVKTLHCLHSTCAVLGTASRNLAVPYECLLEPGQEYTLTITLDNTGCMSVGVWYVTERIFALVDSNIIPHSNA
jgi:hypothetical protein